MGLAYVSMRQLWCSLKQDAAWLQQCQWKVPVWPPVTPRQCACLLALHMSHESLSPSIAYQHVVWSFFLLHSEQKGSLSQKAQAAAIWFVMQVVAIVCMFVLQLAVVAWFMHAVQQQVKDLNRHMRFHETRSSAAAATTVAGNCGKLLRCRLSSG